MKLKFWKLFREKTKTSVAEDEIAHEMKTVNKIWSRAKVLALIRKELGSLGFNIGKDKHLTRTLGLYTSIEIYKILQLSDKDEFVLQGNIEFIPPTYVWKHMYSPFNFITIDFISKQKELYQFTANTEWEKSYLYKDISGPVKQFLTLIDTPEKAIKLFLNEGKLELETILYDLQVREYEIRDCLVCAYILCKIYNREDLEFLALEKIKDYALLNKEAYESTMFLVERGIIPDIIQVN